MNPKNQDYLNFKTFPKIFNNEKIVLSTTIIKYNDENYRQERALVLTEAAIYNVKKTTVKRRIQFEDLDSISISVISSEFVLHIKNSFDYRYLSFEKRTEILEAILYIMCVTKKLCTVFKLHEVDMINLHNVMTTKSDFKNRRVIRPANSTVKIVNLEKYMELAKNDQERTTQLRKETKILYNKKNDPVKEICIEDFELLKILGKGAFGKVVLAQKKDTAKLFAIKILIKKKIIDTDQIEHTKAEKAILQHVSHPFLVGLEYAFQTNQKLYFVMQFMQGGELFQHLRRQKKFSESQAKFYAASIVLGLAHLHNKNYIYRDLKLENLLLDEFGYALLTDFGLAKSLKLEDKAMTFCGTPEYLSPEVLLGKGHNRPTDWWTLGILIFEMVSGIPPFYNQNRKVMYQKIVKEQVVFRSSVTLSDLCKDIVLNLLEKDPLKRLGSVNDSLEVLSHPWFKDIDFELLTQRKLKAPFLPDIKNWEKNFDKEYIAMKIGEDNLADEKDKVELSVLEKFQKDFNSLNFNKDNEQKTE